MLCHIDCACVCALALPALALQQFRAQSVSGSVMHNNISDMFNPGDVASGGPNWLIYQ